MATVKGKLKTQSGDILYPETSADKVVGLGTTIIELEENGSTTAGTWKAKTTAITALVDGQVFLYKIAVAGAATTTLDITANGTSLGAKTVYRVGTTKLTTQYPVGHYLLLVYNSLNTCFRVVNDSDANSYAYVRQYQYGSNVAGSGTKYPLLARYNQTNKNGTYDTAYTKYHTDTTVDTSNGYLYAPKVYSGGKEVVVTDDSRLSDSRPASDVSAWAKASTKPSYSWSEITDKPAITEDGVRAIYHLGAFDTYVDNGDGTATITRATGYLTENDLEGKWVNSISAYYINILNYTEPVYPLPYLYQWNGNSTHYYNENGDTVVIVTQNDKAGFFAQYRLATPYTEKVITDRPLTTLDASGSSWLQNEYEKGLNLASHVVTNYVGTDRVGYRVADALPAGTYTLEIYNGSGNIYLWTNEHRGDQFTNNKTITFTLSSTSPVEVNVSDGSGTTTNCLFMLNEGTTALPYQPYNGKVMHAIDVEGVKLWENGDPTANMAQGVTLSLSASLAGFKRVLIGTRFTTSGGLASVRYDEFELSLSSYSVISIFWVDSSGSRYQRNFEIKDTYLISGDGTIDGSGGYTNAVIPVAIYGIK